MVWSAKSNKKGIGVEFSELTSLSPIDAELAEKLIKAYIQASRKAAFQFHPTSSRVSLSKTVAAGKDLVRTTRFQNVGDLMRGWNKATMYIIAETVHAIPRKIVGHDIEDHVTIDVGSRVISFGTAPYRKSLANDEIFSAIIKVLPQYKIGCHGGL